LARAAESGAPEAALQRSESDLAALAIPGGALPQLAAHCGPLAVVDLETTGLSPRDGAEILEFGALLVEPDAARGVTLAALLRPQSRLPRAVARLTGLSEADLQPAPPLSALRGEIRAAILGRTLVAHNAAFERSFLSHHIDAKLADAVYLDTLDLLALTHPDAPDLRLESFTRRLLGSEEHHRALHDALDTARVMAAVGEGAARDELRYRTARRALESYAPDSPWLALLGGGKSAGAWQRALGRAQVLRETAPPGGPYTGADESEPAPREEPPPNDSPREADAPGVFAEIPPSAESPVPFDEAAIAAALEDEARVRRYFPNYKLRPAQIELARRFARNFERGEVLLAEGGTGVGKSLAYLAAAIPFAMQCAEGEADLPILISTRTKLLQDQLMQRDIAAAAQMLGYAGLRAMSIKGRANYTCARRLRAVLSEGGDQNIFAEDRLAYAVLEASASTRRHGELGSVPAAVLRRYRLLRALQRRAVAARAGQCTREQCARERNCPMGRLRKALDSAHLVVSNHDLLLRWPPDYPEFRHVVADEAHDLSAVADEVYAIEVAPELVLELFDEIFGRPARGRRRGEALLPAARRSALDASARAWRRALSADFVALGRALAERADSFGKMDVREDMDPVLGGAASACAARLEEIAERVKKEAKAGTEDCGPALQRAAEDLREAAAGLQLAFEKSQPDAVASFENLGRPHNRWRLAVRRVSPAGEFHDKFMDKLDSFAGVSASLFVAGDAGAALGDLDLEARAGERLQRASLPSPFNYRAHMRVAALRGGADLVSETTEVLEILARQLGGRTLGLFTSLRRMRQVGDELALRLRGEGLEIIAPRGDADDPGALVERFARSGGVLLGARRFWQGVDLRGDALQAVVIEKLPFEPPTELMRRRQQRFEEAGGNAFERYGLCRMLLNLKQMTGRLIRSEQDRGLVVIVEGRVEKSYFRRLGDALPEGVEVGVTTAGGLAALLGEVGIGGGML